MKWKTKFLAAYVVAAAGLAMARPAAAAPTKACGAFQLSGCYTQCFMLPPGELAQRCIDAEVSGCDYVSHLCLSSWPCPIGQLALYCYFQEEP